MGLPSFFFLLCLCCLVFALFCLDRSSEGGDEVLDFGNVVWVLKDKEACLFHKPHRTHALLSSNNLEGEEKNNNNKSKKKRKEKKEKGGVHTQPHPDTPRHTQSHPATTSHTCTHLVDPGLEGRVAQVDTLVLVLVRVLLEVFCFHACLRRETSL